MSTGGRLPGLAGRWALLLLPAFAAGWPLFRPATLLLHLFFLSFFWLLLAFYRRETFGSWRELGFLTALFAAMLGIGATLARLLPAEPGVLPVPVAALLLTLLYNGRLAMTATVTLSLVLATLDGGLERAPLVYGLAGGVSGALVLRRVRRRSELYAGALAIAAALAGAALVEGAQVRAPGTVLGAQAAIAAGLGLIQVAVAALLLPLAERASGRTTDLTLLELADPTHPLLARLAHEAPGTWAHSLLVANLAEAAANRIGANGLLARVGGYFHDVGKLEAPELFAENFEGRSSPHAAMSPRESARRVRGHVDAGLALAAAARLPAIVRQFIPEHHGTGMLEYFVGELPAAERLRAAADPDFRYAGPRPRSRETAVLMLADAAEASVRVLDERSPDRVRQVLAHLITQRLEAGQFDEAPVTASDLARITEAFVPLLAGMHHARPAYPRSAGGITSAFGRRQG